jgi:hypothetical protein
MITLTARTPTADAFVAMWVHFAKVVSFGSAHLEASTYTQSIGHSSYGEFNTISCIRVSVAHILTRAHWY